MLVPFDILNRIWHNPPFLWGLRGGWKRAGWRMSEPSALSRGFTGLRDLSGMLRCVSEVADRRGVVEREAQRGMRVQQIPGGRLPVRRPVPASVSPPDLVVLGRHLAHCRQGTTARGEEQFVPERKCVGAQLRCEFGWGTGGQDSEHWVQIQPAPEDRPQGRLALSASAFAAATSCLPSSRPFRWGWKTEEGKSSLEAGLPSGLESMEIFQNHSQAFVRGNTEPI